MNNLDIQKERYFNALADRLDTHAARKQPAAVLAAVIDVGVELFGVDAARTMRRIYESIH